MGQQATARVTMVFNQQVTGVSDELASLHSQLGLIPAKQKLGVVL